MSESAGPRMTESRKAILAEVRMSASHPTADEIHERVRERLPRVSLATVYRNLEYLSAHGLVSVLKDPSGRRRYDASAGEHCHVWCVECGDVEDVRLSPSASVSELIESDCGYEIAGYSLSFVGRCPRCGGRQISDRGEETGRTTVQGRRDGNQGLEDREKPADRVRG